VERERVRQALPQVDVLGEDLFSLRRTLLTDPRFQVPTITGESAARTDLVKAQLGRDRAQAATADPEAFLASLAVVCRFERPTAGPDLDRAEELFQRTTQFNTTGRRFSQGELAQRAEAGAVFVGHCRDRFGDYGLVAAAVVEDGEIVAFAMSCRVIGLRVEHRFLEFILEAMADASVEAVARIVETPRNGPVRHLYADNGFVQDGPLWRRPLGLEPRCIAWGQAVVSAGARCDLAWSPTLTASAPVSPKALAGVVVAFDLDGTLVDTAPDLMGTLNTLLIGEGLPPLPVESASFLVGRGGKVMIERGFAAAGEPLDPLRAAVLYDRYISLYRDRIAQESRPFPGLIAALDALEAQGAALAVCTNKRTDLSRALLDALDLTDRFAAVIGADLAPAPKPDARHLLTAIAKAGGDPARALMVGDSNNDVMAARNAGVPVVLVSFGYTEIPVADLDRDILIDHFDQLPAAALKLLR
jgi:phosphoglycolate phosphatase